MFADIVFPEQASTVAGRVDALFIFLMVVTGAVALLVLVLILYFGYRYRRRSDADYPPYVKSSVRLEMFWTIVPFLIFLVMFGWGAQVYFAIVTPPEDSLEVYVVGKQWMWKMQHPDGQREINELHVPLNQPVKLILTSEDVIHSFFVPAFRIKQDVLPGRYVQIWFTATKPGRYHLFCAQYCGTNHSGMRGSVVVQEKADYRAWLDEHAEGSLALEGRKLFLKLQCVSCHSGNSRARAPILEDLYRRPVRLRDGREVDADDDYLRRSILRPAAEIVEGFEPIMPTFQGQVSEEDVIKLIAFIRSLHQGQTPTRTEEAEPPTLPPAGPRP
jgi:cytochrome c oxidase subunit 2